MRTKVKGEERFIKQTLNIRKLRQSKGWTLQYVGDAVGLNKTAIYDIETGRRKPSYDVLVKLEKIYSKKSMTACWRRQKKQHKGIITVRGKTE